MASAGVRLGADQSACALQMATRARSGTAPPATGVWLRWGSGGSPRDHITSNTDGAEALWAALRRRRPAASATLPVGDPALAGGFPTAGSREVVRVAVAASSTTPCTSTWCLATSRPWPVRRNTPQVGTGRNRSEQVVVQACAGLRAALAEPHGAQDHVDLLSLLPKVTLVRLFNSINGVSARPVRAGPR